MNGEVVSKFERIGARVHLQPLRPRFSWSWNQRRFIPETTAAHVALDVKLDRAGEYFDLVVGESRRLSVLDVRPRERHLLLMVRDASNMTKDKFLCGHDERHWFVAAVPDRSTSNVRTAMEALKPAAVRDAQDRAQVRGRDRNRRYNPGFVRQGEWFFVPRPEFNPADACVHRNEPLFRGGVRRGKPHIMSEVVRLGGETVYVSRVAPVGVRVEEYRELIERDPRMRALHWQMRQHDARVYARGSVRHRDHATIELPVWHEVLMNREWETPAMRHVVFLD